MSDMEYWTGQVKVVATGEKLSIAHLKSWCIDNNKSYDSEESILDNCMELRGYEGGVFFTFVDEILYKGVRTEFDQDGLGTLDKDGKFMLSFYNGGIGFDDAIVDLIEGADK